MKKFLKIGGKLYSLVVVLCFVTVGAVITTVIRNNVQESMQRSIALSEKVEIPKITMTPTKAPSTAPVGAQKTQVAKETEPPKEAVTESEPFRIVAPVPGQVINGFSGQELIYDKTFEDWRVHHGIDIAAERSVPVCACAKGVIQEVYADPMDGITIVIDHGNGYQSVYQNLSTDKMVQPGETVEKGQTISGIGETAVSEAALAHHLHFELFKNGEPINPEEYYQ